jgi:LmbE family N-acetylglucosaminyl deacetylase
MNVLVVSPHPDDETLGAGGTILKLIAEGHRLCWLNVTSMGNSNKFTEEVRLNREIQLDKIKKFYNFYPGETVRKLIS